MPREAEFCDPHVIINGTFCPEASLIAALVIGVPLALVSGRNVGHLILCDIKFQVVLICPTVCVTESYDTCYMGKGMNLSRQEGNLIILHLSLDA